MSLETGDFIANLVQTNPLGSDDFDEGPGHFQLIKKVLKTGFNGFPGAVLVTGTVTGTDTLTMSPSPVLPSYQQDMLVIIVPANTNTGAVTLNISSLGAKTVGTVAGAALVAGDLVAGNTYLARYNGTVFHLIAVTKRYVDSFAPLASPAFTGTPTAPTAATTDDSTKIATTAYVKNQVTDQGVFDFNSTDTGDRSVSLNFHAADGAGQEAQIQRAAGVNGSLLIQNFGSGNLNIIQKDTGELFLSTSDTQRWYVSTNGRLGPVGDNLYPLAQSNERPTAIFAVNGTIQTSDKRLKTDIEGCKLGMDFIERLNPVSYRWKVGRNEINPEDGSVVPIPGKRTHYGLLAQEVRDAFEAILPGGDFGALVLADSADRESEMSLRYDQLICPLIKAIQELSKRIDELEKFYPPAYRTGR